MDNSVSISWPRPSCISLAHGSVPPHTSRTCPARLQSFERSCLLGSGHATHGRKAYSVTRSTFFGVCHFGQRGTKPNKLFGFSLFWVGVCLGLDEGMPVPGALLGAPQNYFTRTDHGLRTPALG